MLDVSQNAGSGRGIETALPAEAEHASENECYVVINGESRKYRRF